MQFITLSEKHKVNKTCQLKPRIGAGIWWVMEPHWVGASDWDTPLIRAELLTRTHLPRTHAIDTLFTTISMAYTSLLSASDSYDANFFFWSTPVRFGGLVVVVVLVGPFDRLQVRFVAFLSSLVFTKISLFRISFLNACQFPEWSESFEKVSLQINKLKFYSKT